MKKSLFVLSLIFLTCYVFGSNIPFSIKKIDNSGKFAQLVVTYPVFIGDSELIKEANKGIYDLVQIPIQTNKIFIKESGDQEGFMNTAYATVVRADDKVISVVWRGDWFAGGVHNDIVYTINYGIINGVVKKLTIDNVYDRKLAAEGIINAYNSGQAGHIPQQIEEGEMTVQSILEENPPILLNSFTISNKYITFYREEYEFGYGYEGADFVKLPFNKL